MRRLLTHSLLLAWLAVPVQAESLLESAVGLYLPPNPRLRSSLEEAVRDAGTSDPGARGYLTANQESLDRALQAAEANDCVLSSGFQQYGKLQDLGLALAARGVLERDPADILAALRLAAAACSGTCLPALFAGQRMERAGLRALATWVDGEPAPAPLEQALTQVQEGHAHLPGLRSALATELNRAKRDVAGVCRDPSTGTATSEELLLLSRRGTAERELVLREFSRLTHAYGTLAEESARTGSMEKMREFLERVRQVRRAYRKGARRVVAPSSPELAQALAAALFPDFEPVVADYLWTESYVAALPWLIRLKLQQLQGGGFPGDLAALGGPPPDPFGGTMIYTGSAHGVLLYSRGPDRRDQGGHRDLQALEQAEGSDIVFTLGAVP